MTVSSLHCRLVAAGAALLAGACAPEETVVHYRPYFDGLPGAETGTRAVGPRPGGAAPTDLPLDQSALKNPDGSTRLVTPSIRHLIAHLQRFVPDVESESLVAAQLLSEDTVAHLRSERTQPIEYVRVLRARFEDVGAFLSRMGLGEATPGVDFRPTGRNRYVLEIGGADARGVVYRRLWVALEATNWKLVWID
ncbi:MAG: hypothetical protein JNM07_02240 [Phycisphaerae bacterium]|nr:hypothetical protein [Phycisphaerae bacterium]